MIKFYEQVLFSDLYPGDTFSLSYKGPICIKLEPEVSVWTGEPLNYLRLTISLPYGHCPDDREVWIYRSAK